MQVYPVAISRDLDGHKCYMGCKNFLQKWTHPIKYLYVLVTLFQVQVRQSHWFIENHLYCLKVTWFVWKWDGILSLKDKKYYGFHDCSTFTTVHVIGVSQTIFCRFQLNMREKLLLSRKVEYTHFLMVQSNII